VSEVPIYLDGRKFVADDGKNLLETALTLGFDVPYFCWHPAMGSVGACRQCAVRVYWNDEDEEGEIAMSCMTPIREGLRADIFDEEAIAFRRSIIELLMASHPHDCPVCDEGGACHLQDMTVMTGHIYRRYPYRKRTYRNQDLGPFLTHEMNRCIQCYRCVRFYCDYAGDLDFAAHGLRNGVYFGRYEDGAPESEFSGNLVEVCPVGVFNDKTLAARYTRKWDLQTSPSVCPHCGRGCSTILAERYGELRRVLNRFNLEVNGYFLCDRGRYGYEFVNGERRVRRALLRTSDNGLLTLPEPDGTCGLLGPEPGGPAAEAAESRGPAGTMPSPAARRAAPAAAAVPRSDAVGDEAGAIVQRLAELVAGGGRVLGIGSPRASLEANHALRRLVGPERFHLGMADGERELVELAVGLHRDAGLHSPSTLELESADLAVVLGEDLTNTLPMLAFSIRRWLRLRPTEEEARLRIQRWNDAGVGQVKRHLPSVLWLATPATTKLDSVAAAALRAAPQDIARAALAAAHALDPAVPEVSGLSDEAAEWVDLLTVALKEAERPVVISGVSSGSADVVRAAAALTRALPHAVGLSLVVPEANTMGLALMGGAPLSAASSAVVGGRADAVVVLENDLFRRAGEAEIDELLGGSPYTLVLDHSLTPTAARADAVLPAATWAESTGTFVSHEGRAQRFFSTLVPAEETRDSWRWLAEVLEAAGRAEGWERSDDVLAALAAEQPWFAPALEAAPPAEFRVDEMRVPRQSGRYSGRTAIHAPREMVEPRPVSDPDSPLGFTMEGFHGQPPGSLVQRFWAPGWNSVQSLNKFQEEVGGPLRADDPGRILFEAARDGSGGDPLAGLAAPPAFARVSDEWLVLPLHHAFGGEELSALGDAIAQRMPVPYIGLGEEDAAVLGGGGVARLEWGGWRRRLPVRVVPGLPRGVAGLPAGLPGLAGLHPPFRARILLDVGVSRV
jgi:NADH-quinone oxidoreductase subunit G